MLRKEYMGELSLPLNEWFPSGTVALSSDKLPVSRYSLARVADTEIRSSLVVSFLLAGSRTSQAPYRSRSGSYHPRTLHPNKLSTS